MITASPIRGRLQPYLPRLTLEWLAMEPDRLHRAIDASMVFVDISGFTALSEKLAKLGRVGAEEMASAINACFSELLVLAYKEDGSLLKFGGDALLLLFTGDTPAEHAARAARAAIGMRKRLRKVGLIQTPGGRVRLRMSVGVHTGRFDFFLVGDSHRELIVTGPAATQVVTMEGTAEAGEIVISPATAALLPAGSVGDPKGPGSFLRSVPPGEAPSTVSVLPDVPDDLLRRSVPLATRDSLLAGVLEPEHRQVAVGFIHFDGTDELIEGEGAEVTARELDRLVRDTQAAVDDLGVCFLASDVDADGGKLILSAGAPRAVGDDEERILLALRRIVERERRIPVRIGVNHGPVFAGDIGPHYRRTYTVMGDTVNLAARLMAKASPDEIYASGSVLERSATRFETTELEPFLVKGKARPVQAWSLGVPLGRPKHTAAEEFPLHGRREEMRLLKEAQNEVREGQRRTVVLQAEAGLGKTRLLDEVLKGCGDFLLVGATGETFTSTTPYVAWRDALRDLIDVQWEDMSDVVTARLVDLCEEHDRSLLPWLPLIGTAVDADIPSTPEVDAIGPEFRRAKLNEVVIEFLRAIRTEPTFFAFEDAHLMDDASADLLAAIATDDRSDRPWLIVALRRQEGAGFAPRPHPTVTTIDLTPVDAEAIQSLAEEVTEDAPLPGHVLSQIVDRSNGNPQLLLDLIHAARSGDGSLPDSVESAATVRIDSLTPHDRQLVRRVSVFGLAFHPRFLADVLDGDASHPDDATWERLAEFFESEGGGYLRFRRAVIRDAAYAGLPFRTRQRLHLAVGLDFEASLPPNPEENAGLLSLHFGLAGEHEKTWRYAHIAAKRATKSFANIEAAELFQRAIDAGRRLPDVSNPELCAAYEEMAEALMGAGEFRGATVALSAALRLAKGDALTEGRILLERSRMEDRLGRYRLSLRWATRALRTLEGIRGRAASAQRARVMAWYAEVLQSEGRTKDAIAWCGRATREAKRSGERRAAAQAHWVLGWADIVRGRPSAHNLGEALRIYEEIGYLKGQAQMLQNMGGAAFLESRWDDAVDLWERGRDLFLRIGDPVSAAASQGNLSEVLVEQGHVLEAERHIKDAVRAFRAAGDRYTAGTALSQQGRVVARLGRFDEALETLALAREELRDLGAQGDAIDVDARIAECYALMGRSAEALLLAEETLRSLAGSEGGSVSGPLLHRVRGYALAQVGDAPDAFSAFQTSAEEARARGASHEVALAEQAIVRLRRLLGEEATPELQIEADRILMELDIIAVWVPPLVAPDAEGGPDGAALERGSVSAATSTS